MQSTSSNNLLTTPPKRLFPYIKKMNDGIYGVKNENKDGNDIDTDNGNGNDNTCKFDSVNSKFLVRPEIRITTYQITVFYDGKVFRGDETELIPTTPLKVALKLAKRYEDFQKKDYKMILRTNTHEFSFLVKNAVIEDSSPKKFITSVVPVSTRRKSLTNLSEH